MPYNVVLCADLSREQLESKAKYCRELLQVAEVLAPGQSLLRGTLLLELQATLVALARLLLSNDIITQDDSKVSEAIPDSTSPNLT